MTTVADDTEALPAAYVATRTILRTRDAITAQHAVVSLCRALGAEVGPADGNPPDSLPTDLSLG